MTDEIDRDFQYRGLTLHFGGRDRGDAPYRGFFRGDPWNEHGHGEAGGEDTGLTVEVAGQVHTLHRTETGELHAHDLPFESFATPEDAAKAIVDQLHPGAPDGPAAEPETPL